MKNNDDDADEHYLHSLFLQGKLLFINCSIL